MKVLSLFDGISCGMVALERAGIPVDAYYASEIEPNAIKISQQNYPQIIQLGDITQITEEILDAIMPIDMVIGGSPCQDLSIYKFDRGEVTGLNGEKSGLFYHYVRILKYVQPKYFLLENVPMEERWKNQISELLGVEPIMINSNLVCAADRKRLYWTNIRGIEQPIDQGIVLKDIVVPAEEVPEKYWYNKPFVYHGRTRKVQATLEVNSHRHTKEVYNLDGKCNTLTCVSGGYQEKKVFQDGRCRKLMPIEYERLQTLPDGYTEGISDSARYTACGNGWTVDVIAHILSYLSKEHKKQTLSCFGNYDASNNQCMRHCEFWIECEKEENKKWCEEREEEEMELKIYNPAEDGFVKAIEWNHEEIKEMVSEKVSYYKGLVYTEDEIKSAKTDRATLNKFVAALESKRKEIKKQCLAPYEDFEKKMMEIVAIVNEPINLIDSQVKAYEEKQKQEKLEKIKEYWANQTQASFLTFEQIFDSKWLNASVSMKSIQEEINSRLEQVANDLITLQNLPEFGFEAVEVYKTTLDLNKALNEGRRLSEIQKRKAEHEAEQARLAAEAEAKAQAEQVAEKTGEMVLNNAPDVYAHKRVEPVEPAKQWVSFKAHLTVDQARELKQFFDDRCIEFEAI